MIDLFSDKNICPFRRSLKQEFNQYLDVQSKRYNRKDCLKIDLHCHDYNSDVPDELWGRILGLPETWLKTKKLVNCLQNNSCDVITITNHNNARSCWKLQEKGVDVLVAAEFTCHFDEYDLFVHVLCYGFTKEQEIELNARRKNIYDFVRYAAGQDLVLILPHPLYFYTRNDKIDIALFEKLAVMFQRFEVLNGQRDIWQSVLTLNWIQSLTPEKIRVYARKHNLSPEDFAVDPDRPKILTGGSDCHMGIFAGECGSYLHVPDLDEKLKTSKPSELALQALRDGNMVPFGHIAENQKLNIALLDYFSQAATRIEDPGLLRILFHRGEASDKFACFVLANLLLEMQKSRNSQKFFGFIHDALSGKKMNKLIKWKIKKDYQFCIKHLENIADSKSDSPEEFIKTVNTAISDLFTELNQLIIQRLANPGILDSNKRLERFSTEEIARKFEVPSQLSALFLGSGKSKSDFSGFNVKKLLDNLTFPVMVSVVLLGTSMASTRVLYQNRVFLNNFSDHVGKNRHPRRALYLTDTLRDKNGVSNSLSAKLKEIQRTDMDIDFLICHEDALAEPHLHVVRPLTSFSLPDFGEQIFRVPNLLEIVQKFYEGGYDRIICSTEGPMSIVALFIKHMFNVPSFFFMHTDWLAFIKDTTDLTVHERDRVRRALRVFYKQFSGVFVLNNDDREWLTGHHMQLNEESVLLTAHHTNVREQNITELAKDQLFSDATKETPILFFASRLSKEKGVYDLPKIISAVREKIPDIKIVIAGSGPAESELKEMLPDALFLGWVNKARIAQLYASLDLFVFPSRFDTFGNVVLEAFSYGMPVIAYNCKGPKDIIKHDDCGYLVDDVLQMGEQIIRYFDPSTNRQLIKHNAINRHQDYQAEPIMSQFLTDLGLDQPAYYSQKQRSAA